MGDTRGEDDFRGVGVGDGGVASTSSATPIDSSNIGFQILKKHGWKEGTGLGISEQGRLEPVQAYLKKNKRGLGADKVKTAPKCSENIKKPPTDGKTDELPSRNKAKNISKRMKKMQEFEKQLQEKEFERAFFREFWPDNV
uniref:Putative G patch domain and ankyrin repeat-containing protein 1 n=1 Tax=Davidia involucrata TaxID=16924 RepID=A0A5B7BEH3_DAVIN